jgi:hypothetical protein
MTDDHMPLGGSGEEAELRYLLRGAVEGLEPSEGALERLRYAVPLRRTRRRQALIGAAVATVLAGTAIPATVHLTGTASEVPDHSAMAGHGEHHGATGGSSSAPHQNGQGTRPRSSPSTGQGGDTAAAAGQGAAPHTSGSPSGGSSAGPADGGATAGATAGTGGLGMSPLPPAAAPGVPGCSAAQLGVAGAARSPEADGTVYGSFKVTNVSAKGCTVTGPDTVTAATVTGPPPGRGPAVAVVGHAAGDPAKGLPDPSAETPLLLLQPNDAYEVRFAFVPSGGSCPAQSPDPQARAPQNAPGTLSARTGGEAAEAGGSTTQTGATPPAQTGVAVSHTPRTPQADAPATETTVQAACPGTVYRTGVIPLEEPPKP